MTTPTPGNGLDGAVRQLTMLVQALLHQQQTQTNLPSSSAQMLRQARQNLTPGSVAAGLLGGGVPSPGAPTGAWLQQAAMSLVSQVALNQPRRAQTPQGPPAGPTPPTVPPSQPAVTPPYPYMWGAPYGGGGGGYNGPQPGPYPGPIVAPSHQGGGGGGGTGIGSWVKSSLPRVGAMVGGPWGAVAGTAVAAATGIPAEVRSQRDKNAFYQSIEGGSNFDGFAERAHEEAYRWTTFGVLSSDEARKAFKGVTKLGYNSKVEGGEGRQDALDFIYHGKTRRGATVDESLQTLQVASKNALTNFNDLSNALNEVSDSAGKAGVNSQMARAEFTQLMDVANKSGYGSSAVGVAALEQQTKNSYGRSFQDMDVSKRLGVSHAYMASSIAGISVSEYLTSGPTAKGAADQLLDSASVRAALKPGVEAWIKEQISKSGGDVSEETATQIGEELIQKFYPNDAFALAQVVGTLSGNGGLSQDPVKAATWIVQQYNGKGAGATASNMKKQDQKSLEKTSESNRLRTDVKENLRPHASGGRGGVVTGALKGLDKETSGGFLGFGGDPSDAVSAYEKWHKKTGDEDPVVYNLLNKIDGDDKSKVAITTKDGKRVVSLTEAIKNHRNELASGKAVVVEGDKAGKSVAEILGDDKVDPLRDFSKEAKASGKVGESYEEWEKKHTTKDKKGREKLEIGLTAEARRLLTVLDSTGVNGSAATASPPLSPYPSNPSYQE
ncbi:hypothetical protein E6R60_27010 [Streptomyces sp. A0642]|uniref:hypothetical protein n=1 Tax=Streptomyces sp. A0642 TaxID=2563100 RepID=UPI0010A24C62|nr:hypothetical protein [Streptomyces sp. A0642]THA72582.1 hypothetical protein E6R60_27010 [Streptomyces sp. A0642]